jgi:hypothetical protein
MKTKLSDGRIFETQTIEEINYRPDENVYKFEFKTYDRIVKSSPGHIWGVGDKKQKIITMKSMKDIDKDVDELLVQSWDE